MTDPTTIQRANHGKYKGPTTVRVPPETAAWLRSNYRTLGHLVRYAPMWHDRMEMLAVELKETSENFMLLQKRAQELDRKVAELSEFKARMIANMKVRS